MHARKAEPRDLPSIRDLASSADFPSPNLEGPTIEALWVVVGEDDEVLMAVIAERIPQIFMLSREFEHPAAKLAAIRMLYGCRQILKDLGYNSAEGFIEPGLAKRFGRRLERTFGAIRNWPSWTIKL